MSFDRVASIYEVCERLALGSALQACRTSLLDELVPAQRTLIFGEGDGRFLASFLRKNVAGHVDCIESSQTMIAVTQRRLDRLGLSWRSRVTFYCCDARTWEPQGSRYDLVITLFFLDCFRHEDVEGIIRGARRKLTPDGEWLVCEFALPKRGWSRLRAWLWTSTLYTGFRLLTGIEARQLPDHVQAMRLAGLRLITERRSQHGMLTAQRWKLATSESAMNENVRLAESVAA